MFLSVDSQAESLHARNDDKLPIPSTSRESFIPLGSVLDQREISIRSVPSVSMPRLFSSHLRKSLDVPVMLGSLTDTTRVQATALIDLGCSVSAIDTNFVQTHWLPTLQLDRPINIQNVDGSRNTVAHATSYVQMKMTMHGHEETIPLLVIRLHSHDVFIGHDWLSYHNPSVNWRSGTITFDRGPKSCGKSVSDFVPLKEYTRSVQEEGDALFAFDIHSYLAERSEHIRAYQTISTKLASSKVKSPSTFKERVPRVYWSFSEVFAKESFDSLPERRPWDHAIELTPEFKPVTGKVYPLSRDEQVQLDAFIEENLASGRIRDSKSPMASPFFFIKKKDGTLRPIQDYCQLNEMTIKNQYPLPLIQELIDHLKQAKCFTKLNV